VLKVESLAFGFPGRTVGRDVSFELAAGEVMCVLGPNGGGKTTLFRTVLGLLEKHSGSITLDGRPIESLSRAGIARLIGYVPQGHSGYFAYTVRDFVLMGRTAHLGIFSAPSAKDHGVALRALESLGMAHLAERPVTEISGGERQLALVARALAQEPRLLVLDEPTAGVDPAGSREIRDLILDFKKRGITVLLCSHLLEQVQEICDRIGILNRGEMIREGKLEDLISIQNQTELILENASPELLAELQAAIAKSKARLVEQRQPQKTLERYFLDVTGPSKQ